MRLPHLLLLPLLLTALPCLPVQAKAKPPAPRHTALVGTINLWNSKPSDRDFDLQIIGGPVAGKG